jgi:hypothetical protein
LQSDESVVGLEAALGIDRPEGGEGVGGGFGASLKGDVQVGGEAAQTSDQLTEVDPSGQKAPDLRPPLQETPGASVQYAENIIVPTTGRDAIHGFDPNNPEQVQMAGQGVFGSRINAPRDPRAAGWGEILRV